MTVALSGAFAGTVFDNTYQIGGTTSGKIKNNGELTGSITWDGYEPISMTGTVSLSANGSSLTGTILVDGEATIFNLARQ